MRSFFAWATALALLCAAAGSAAAQDQDQVTVAMQNSDAVARKLFSTLIERQIGAPVAPDKFWAYEVDFNLDGFSEIYGFVDQPDCDGTRCGLFLFVLEGETYREVLGDLPGVRLTDPARVFLGAFKRNGFLELQFDQSLAGWNGERYADIGSFPASTLYGSAYLDVCGKANPDDAAAPDGTGQSACQCRLERFQAIAFTQDQLDRYARYVADPISADNDADDGWDDTLNRSNDVVTGCEVVAGTSQWQPGYFQHGEQEQAERLDFDAFIDACKGQDWIVSHRKVGSPDRALGVCGCIARELPTYGVTQDQLDMLASYYRGEFSDNDLDSGQPDLLPGHDSAAEACLSQFPGK